jgi:DNA-binding beta-propeller fold protein YncE
MPDIGSQPLSLNRERPGPIGVYVGNYGSNSVAEFRGANRKSRGPECTVSNLYLPNGIGVNAQHYLYVPTSMSAYDGKVSIFEPLCGALVAQVSLPVGVDNSPTDVAFDNKRKIAYVGTYEDSVYPLNFDSRRFGKPLKLLCAPSFRVDAVAVDQRGDVFAADSYGSQASVVEWVGGAGNCKILAVTGFGTIIGLLTDSENNLIDTDHAGKVLVWKPPYDGMPNRTISCCGGLPVLFGKLDRNDNLYLTVQYGGVQVINYQTGKVEYGWGSGLSEPVGIGIDEAPPTSPP